MAIKLGGKTATPAAPKRRSTAKAPAKRAAASNGRKRSAATSTPKRAARTAKPAAANSNRRPTTDDPKVIKEHVKEMTKVGKRYQAARVEHEDAVNAVYEAATEAMEAGVPTGVITDTLGLSRQWLYKMGSHGGRNGSGSKSKAKAAVKSTGSRRTAKRAAASSTRPRIRTRS